MATAAASATQRHTSHLHSMTSICVAAILNERYLSARPCIKIKINKNDIDIASIKTITNTVSREIKKWTKEWVYRFDYGF